MTNNFKNQLTPPSTAEVFLFLLKIEHEQWENPFYIVNDNIGHTVDGIVYEPYAFEFVLQKNNNVSGTTIVLDDIDRRFTAALNSVLTPPTATIKLVSNRDMTVSEGNFVFKLNKISISGTNVTATIAKESVLENKLTGHYISSTNFPGLFK